MFWYDGQINLADSLSLDINAPALLYGASVFTTLRVYHKSLYHPLTHWLEHRQRLLNTILAFGWPAPDWERIETGAKTLEQHYPILRIAIFPDGKEWIIGRFLSLDLPNKQSQGIRGWLATDEIYRRTLASHKTGNYLPAWLAREKAKSLGAQEAILVNSAQDWLETSTGNLWGIKQGAWFTPSLETGILGGIVRQKLLRWLESQHIPVSQNPWTGDFCQDLDAVAYTNSGVEIIPFREIVGENCSQCYQVTDRIFEPLRSYFQQF